MSTSTAVQVARGDVAGGTALLVAGLALLGASLLEFAPGEARGDGDNPADSLRYLAEFGDLYSYSGLALVVAGVALVVGVITVHSLQRGRGRSLGFDTVSVFGVLAAGFFATTVVMRMQASGTMPHTQSLDESWGEAAYLVVQMAGTQGLLSTGMIALALWLVAASTVFARRGVRAPAVVAVFPVAVLLVLIGDIVAPSLAGSLSGEGVFLAYIAAALFGLPVSCAAVGLALVMRRSREKPRTVSPQN